MGAALCIEARCLVGMALRDAGRKLCCKRSRAEGLSMLGVARMSAEPHDKSGHRSGVWVGEAEAAKRTPPSRTQFPHTQKR